MPFKRKKSHQKMSELKSIGLYFEANEALRHKRECVYMHMYTFHFYCLTTDL